MDYQDNRDNVIKILGALIVVISSTTSQNTTPPTLKPIISPKDKFDTVIFFLPFHLLQAYISTQQELVSKMKKALQINDQDIDI